MAKTEPFEQHYELYERWFDENKCVYLSEIEAVKSLLPKEGRGIEIGVGSGRFASPLGIDLGLEPSTKMRELAIEHDIITIDGSAENIPIGSSAFDYVLMVTTVCFLDDLIKSFFEVNRILKMNGKFLIGFIDRNSKIGKFYEEHKNENPFYKYAEFYSTEELISVLERSGFSNFEYRQTLFSPLAEVKTLEPVLKGFGKGSFVVISATKTKGIR